MEASIRLKIFDWLHKQTLLNGGVLKRSLLEKWLTINGERITLIGAKGIWKPKSFKYPISITTTSNSPYNDKLSGDFLSYSYRGMNPHHPDNVGLREMMSLGIPLIYFHAIMPGKYLATWPVFIQSDDILNLTFKVAVDDVMLLDTNQESSEISRRSYLTSQVKRRLHQQSFRERVLQAYNIQCTLCMLKHRELLDAAHIIPDSQPKGESIIQNGLTLCKIHHAAFDTNIIGISPDYKIHIQEDVLREIDGPMLKYGIQSLENKSIHLPRRKTNWPDKERLDWRYEGFLKTG